MNVRLISMTQAVPGTECSDMSTEALIIFKAKVSNPEKQSDQSTYARLAKFLIESKHWSPFEMVSFCVEIETSRAIAQQILRHRSFSFQEFSQRYSAVTEIEPVELRMQAEKNRQSSTHVLNSKSLNALRDKAIEHCRSVYNELLHQGVAKESARFVLPLCTQTTMYMHGTVRSWIHYLEKRVDEHAQKEHQLIAMEIQKIFIKQFPNVAKALDWDHNYL